MATLSVPVNVPSPAEDCKTLMKASGGFIADKKEIIRILGHRNASQRKKISDTFQQIYNKPLIGCLQFKLSPDFTRAVNLWVYDPPERDASLARKALTSWEETIRELQVLVEIACASSPHHLAAVRRAYCDLFHSSLEEDIISNVSLPVQKVLLGLVSSYRYDKEAVDSYIANREADILHNAIRAKSLDEDDLVLILSTRNTFQLRATFQCYKDNYGRSIDEDILACGEGILESILKVMVWCIVSPEKHFAKVVRDSILGLGTDEESLTRAIVSRAEIDMMKVKGEYSRMYESSLEDDVKGDTSWDYKDFLMTLLGNGIKI